MFDGIAEYEGRKTELPLEIFFYQIAHFVYRFFLIYFYLTIWYINAKKYTTEMAEWLWRCTPDQTFVFSSPPPPPHQRFFSLPDLF